MNAGTLPYDPDLWRPMGNLEEAWHCQRCHRVVRVYEFDGDGDKLMILAAHTAFNCLDEPVVPQSRR